MQVLEHILATLPVEPVAVRRVLVGIHWTAVCSRHCGIASTLTGEHLPYALLDEVGEYTTHHTAQSLAQFVLSDNHYECSIGMAAVNSLLSPTPAGIQELNAYDWIYANCPGKDMAIVGHFPFVDKVREKARNLWVLEKNPRPGDLPASDSKEYLAKAQIIAITGSTLVNHSFEEVIAMCNPSATIMVLGPSTPLSPVLFDHGVSVISGATVADEEKALLTIEQGGAFPQLQGIKRVTIFKEGVNP
jgi:uncharacterized protein (DUF4213/DUF364 family)